jgi:serine protease Do
VQPHKTRVISGTASLIRSLCARSRLLLFAFLSIATGVCADLPDTIERNKLSVVAVGTYDKTRSPPLVYRGTGFIVGSGTLVATNSHVLADLPKTASNESLVVIAFPARGTPQPRQATIAAVDRTHDLAVLRITGEPLPALTLQESSAVREGQTFAFTGFPLGNLVSLSAVTHRAMISSITPLVLPSVNASQLNEKMVRHLKTDSVLVYQLDATAYPGNSGSPLYDVDSGRVVGIINMVFVRGTRGGMPQQASGISFAIPVQFLQQLLKDVP